MVGAQVDTLPEVGGVLHQPDQQTPLRLYPMAELRADRQPSATAVPASARVGHNGPRVHSSRGCARASRDCEQPSRTSASMPRPSSDAQAPPSRASGVHRTPHTSTNGTPTGSCTSTSSFFLQKATRRRASRRGVTLTLHLMARRANPSELNRGIGRELRDDPGQAARSRAL